MGRTELVGKSARTVEGWEQAKHLPPAEALYVLAGALSRRAGIVPPA